VTASCVARAAVAVYSGLSAGAYILVSTPLARRPFNLLHQGRERGSDTIEGKWQPAGLKAVRLGDCFKMPYRHARGWDEHWPGVDQARAVVAYLRGNDNFPRSEIDWLAAGSLGGNLVGDSDPYVQGVETEGPPARARFAMEARRAIVSGDRPRVHEVTVSFETLGAVYFRLTAGQYMLECPNLHSPEGRHRWRFGERDIFGVRSLSCDYCGDERVVSATWQQRMGNPQ